MRGTTYKTIIDFISENCSYSKLLDNEKDFERKKMEQNKSGLYVNLTYQCKCGNIFNRSFSTIKRSNMLRCKDCNIESMASSHRLSMEEINKILLKYNLSYVDGKIMNHNSHFNVRCSCGEIFSSTLRIIKNSNGAMCPTCRREHMRNIFKTDFDKITQSFVDNGCILLSKEEDFENYHSKLKFIAKCGHEYKTSYSSFIESKYKVCKECQKYLCVGENAYNWKGGIYTNERDHFTSTFEYKKWVSDVYKRDNYTCKCCDKYGHKLNAHHLDGYNWCVEKRTDVDNGITLCEDCHKEFHKIYGYGDNTKEQYEEWILNKNY